MNWLIKLEIDVDLLLSNRTICQLFGIKSQTLRGEVSDICTKMWLQPTISDEINYRGVSCSADLFPGLMNKHLTPTQVALLISLHEAGATPRKTKKISPAPQELRDYATIDEADLRKESDLRRSKRCAEAEEQEKARIDRLARPEAIPEGDFSFSLLNDLFFHHQGKGSGQMVIGGIEVTKSLTNHPSNSGRPGWTVRFSWRGIDGERRELVSESPYIV